jgi:hypothetical protein
VTVQVEYISSLIIAINKRKVGAPKSWGEEANS